MQLFPKLPPAPTTILDISDLRDPNEFDHALLAEEGTRHGDVVIRGASIVAESRPAKTPPPLPARAQELAPVPTAEAAMLYAPVQVLRLPERAPAPPSTETTARNVSLRYAGLFGACVCVAGSLALLLTSVI